MMENVEFILIDAYGKSSVKSVFVICFVFVNFWEVAVFTLKKTTPVSLPLAEGRTVWPFSRRQPPFCIHLHARKPARVDLPHHQLLLPWEPKQRSPSPLRTQRLSHTFWHVYTPNRAGQELLRKTLVSGLPSSLSCLHSHTHTNMFSIFSFSPHWGSGQTMCEHVVQARQCENHVCNCASLQFCLEVRPLLRSMSFLCPFSALQSWCHGEGMGTLITLWHFVSVTAQHLDWLQGSGYTVFCF